MMRRVLVVTPYYEPFTSGTVAFVVAMARRLAADGCQVTVLTTGARRAADFWQRATDPPLPATEDRDGVHIERLALRYPRPAPYAFGILRRAGHWLARSPLPAAVQRPVLRRLSRAMPPLVGLPAALARLVPAADLVQSEDSSWDGLFCAAAECAREHGRPHIALPLMHLGSPHVQIHFQMAHQVDAYRAAAAVLALSEREAAAYARLGVDAARIHRLSMGVDVPPAPLLDPELGHAFRREHGIRRPLVAFLGANTYDKGAFTLVRAVAALNRAGAPVDAAFAGPGSDGLAAYLARQPVDVRAALDGHVHILGIVDERTKHALLSACDVFALPSQVDTFGIVLLEAWLHGKPVIGADAGGIPELVAADETGLLVRFDDADALAAAIRRLVADIALRDRLGAAGRALTLARYTWDATYRSLLDIYESIPP